MIDIDAKKFYKSRQVADFLGVTAETAKAYCRMGKLAGTRVGPRKEWQVIGSEIIRLRDEWNLKMPTESQKIE